MLVALETEMDRDLIERQRHRRAKRQIDWERDINEMILLKVYLGDSNRQPQPSREWPLGKKI